MMMVVVVVVVVTKTTITDGATINVFAVWLRWQQNDHGSQW